MRKTVLISILIVFSTILVSCNVISENKTVPIELIAFNSLTDEERDLLPASPKDSTVEKVTVNDENKHYIDKNYEKPHAYAVIFNHTETDSSGNITVFIDLDKKTVIGKGFSRK